MGYVSIRAIAQKAGVSTATVSVALRNQPGVSDSVRLKVQGIARELGYQPPALLHEAMGQLRMKLPGRFHGRVAVCTNFSPEDWKGGWKPHWNVVEQRAAKLGYALEVFFLSKWTARTLQAAFHNRNIRGTLLIIFSWLSADMEFLYERFACVLIGQARSRDLPIHFVEADQFQAGKKAMQEVLARGYQRIGWVRSRYLDSDGLYHAGICSMVSDGVYLSTHMGGVLTPEGRQSFLDWVAAEKPDCILTLLEDTRGWLTAAGYSIPGDIGIAHLAKARGVPEDWSGVDPLREEITGAALTKLISMLRQGESGVPAVQEATLIEGIWSEGATLRPSQNRLTYDHPPARLESCENKSSTLKCLDLRPYVNRSLSGSGGWFGQVSLLHCPPGEHEICGTRFRILDEAKESKAALIMGSQHCPGDETPNPVRVDIIIGRRIKSLHFLHACGWSKGLVRPFAHYHFLDSKGRGQTLPLIDRRALGGPESDGNIQDYYPHFAPLTGPHVRPVHLTAYGKSELYSAYLYILEWVNPHSRKIIQTLRITSNPEAETTLGILAITAQL